MGARSWCEATARTAPPPVTRAGQDFYKDKHSEYVVHVQAVIEGKRRDGSIYRRVTNAGNNERAQLLVSMLGLGKLLESDRYTPEQAQARVRTLALGTFAAFFRYLGAFFAQR